MRRQQFFHGRNRHIFFQFNGERLAVAAQRTDAHAQTINRDHGRGVKNFVGFSLSLPLFAALTVIKLFVDPRNQATGQRYAKVINRQFTAAGQGRHFTFDIENSRGRGCQFIGHMAIQMTHLGQQFAHMARAAAGGRLIGRHRNPVNQVIGKQATEGHQHQANGTVAADKGLNAFVQAVGDDILVNRIENNDGIVFHTQRRGCVNPVTLPTAFTKLWIDFVGIIAALTGHDDIERLQRIQIKSVLKCAGRGATERRCRLPELGSRKENRANGVEVTLLNHALHENRADHTAPADKTNIFHSVFSCRDVCCVC